MRRNIPLAVAVLACLAAAPDVPKATTIEAILKSVPKDKRGPKNSIWTKAQLEGYSTSLRNTIEDQSFSLPAGKVEGLSETQNGSRIRSSIPNFSAAGVTCAAAFVLNMPNAEPLSKVKFGQSIKVTGRCSRAEIVTMNGREYDILVTMVLTFDNPSVR